MAFRKLRSDASSITYADPANPDLTVRVKQSSSTKNLGNSSIPNITTEIIINDLFDVTVGSEAFPEALSVRTKVSGSYLSKTQKKALVGLMTACLTAWANEDVLDGFEPATVPVMPV